MHLMNSTQTRQNILQASASYELDAHKRAKHQNLMLETLENHKNVMKIKTALFFEIILL